MVTIDTEINQENINDFIYALNLCWDKQVELSHYEKVIYSPNFNLGEFEEILNEYDLEIKVGDDSFYVDRISSNGLSLKEYHKEMISKL